MWLWGETDYVSSYDMWWCPQLHVDRPGFTNPCQLCQTLGGINLRVDIEDSMMMVITREPFKNSNHPEIVALPEAPYCKTCNVIISNNNSFNWLQTTEHWSFPVWHFNPFPIFNVVLKTILMNNWGGSTGTAGVGRRHITNTRYTQDINLAAWSKVVLAGIMKHDSTAGS